MEFKVSSLKERYLFYKKEFNIKKVSSWINLLQFKPQFYTVDLGTETKITKFPQSINKMIFLKSNINLQQLKSKLIHYIPEDVYYDRNIYSNLSNALTKKHKKLNSGNITTQELAFDIDSNNIECTHNNKSIICEKCLKICHEKTIELQELLKKQFNKIKIVYSGRGFHIHVLDKKAYYLTLKQRTLLNNKFKKFPIDEWVSRGNIRLIRLPYSLNSLVSRICIPINHKDKFEKIINKKSVPRFLRGN